MCRPALIKSHHPPSLLESHQKAQIIRQHNPTKHTHHIYYVPTIIKNGCQLKNLHPAPSGRVAAQYPPIKAWPKTTASSERYFAVGSGVIFAMLEKID